MTVITVVADFYFKPDQIDAALAVLQALIQATRLESGCLSYELHRSNEQANHFVMIEQWQTHALWQQHMQTPHVAVALQAIQPCLEGEIGVESFLPSQPQL
jgi:quinol monooxygenase YgiN